MPTCHYLVLDIYAHFGVLLGHIFLYEIVMSLRTKAVVVGHQKDLLTVPRIVHKVRCLWIKIQQYSIKIYLGKYSIRLINHQSPKPNTHPSSQAWSHTQQLSLNNMGLKEKIGQHPDLPIILIHHADPPQSVHQLRKQTEGPVESFQYIPFCLQHILFFGFFLHCPHSEIVL